MPETHSTYIPKSILASLDRPLLIWAAPVLLILDALLICAFAVLVVASENVHVSVGHDPFSAISNRWVVALACLNCFVNVCAIVGFIREKRWARPALLVGHSSLVIAFFIVGVAAGANPGIALYNLVPFIGVVLFELWYLYRRASVVNYYARIPG